MGLYRVLAGKAGFGSGPSLRVYRKGDVVESAYDLAAVSPTKFERVGEPGAEGSQAPAGEGPAPAASASPVPAAAVAAPAADAGPPRPAAFAPNLDGMTVTQLRAVAEAEEVDLSGLARKDEIIAALRRAASAATA